jgi:4-amino-4-deoxy-L-arabinose transferase-like glycosyltransferase
VTDGSAHPNDDRTLWNHALAILAFATVLRLALAAVVPLFPDEAYYWEWSRRLAGGYFDHPPMIAWLIAAGTALLGDTPIGVRLVPVIVGSSGGLAMALAARHLAGARAARYVALTFLVLPLAAAGLVLATPDAPLLAAITWTLYFVVRALGEAPGSAASTRWWAIGGVAIGAAMASKFTGVFIPFALLLAFALHAPLRARFREPGPYVAVVIASLVMAPVLLWNAQHDWIAFRFQLGHGLGTNAKENLLQRELNLVGSQFGLVTPILFVLILGATWRALRPPRHDARFALAVVSTFCALFFVYSATRRNVEANWPAIAWLPALILLGAAREGLRTAWERRAIWLAGTLSAALLLHVVFRILPLPARRDQVSQAYGWKEYAASVDSVFSLDAPEDGRRLHLAANRYQDAALLNFHSPHGEGGFTALNLGGRRNQYDLWSRFTDTAKPGDDLLLSLEIPRAEGLPGPIRRLTMHFTTITPGPVIPLLRDGETVANRQLWMLTGWDGSWPADSTDPRAPRD